MMKSKLIVALDVPEESEAKKIVEELHDCVAYFKVGMQMFTRFGPGLVSYIRGKGADVFLDLKFHDIPNTVAHAVTSAGSLDVGMLTIHASGGSDMMHSAMEAAGKVARKPVVLAVTVLTSMDQSDMEEIGIDHTVSGQVLNLARLAQHSKVDGLVCSAHEISLIKNHICQKLTLVVPGIRPAGADTGDQKRIMTPRQAIDAGAGFLVIGRPIIEAPDRRKAAEDILAEID